MLKQFMSAQARDCDEGHCLMLPHRLWHRADRVSGTQSRTLAAAGLFPLLTLRPEPLFRCVGFGKDHDWCNINMNYPWYFSCTRVKTCNPSPKKTKVYFLNSSRRCPKMCMVPASSYLGCSIIPRTTRITNHSVNGVAGWQPFASGP